MVRNKVQLPIDALDAATLISDPSTKEVRRDTGPNRAAEQSTVDFVQVMALLPDMVFVLDGEGRLVYVNEAGGTIFGMESAPYLGCSMLDFIHPDDAMLALSSMETVRTKQVGTPIEVRLAVEGTPWKWFEVIGRDCLDVPGINGVLVGARDLTQRRMWEIAANDVTRFQQILHHAAALVLSLDAEGTVTAVNGALNRLLGVDPSLAVGSDLGTFAMPGHHRSLSDAVAKATALGSASVEVAMRHAKTGVAVPIRFEIVNLLDDPVVKSFIVTGQDMSGLDAARRRLEHLATHDVLTGLANRSLLTDRLQSLVEARRPLALLYADSDHFKPINDAHGHDVGDEVLRCVALRMTEGVGEGDLVARVGGDEFVVLALGITDRMTAVKLADRLQALIASPFQVSAGMVTIGVSVGAVVAAPDSSAAELWADADFAMYAAKAARTPKEVP
jgi:diguanylate cyclase (GGDEF)-like protein/PAS domain S-box-containing protein